MQTFYPCEQASTLLSNLAANESLRQQLLANPEETFRQYGFEVDRSAMPAQIELAGNNEYENALAKLDAKQLQQHQAKQAIALFRFK